ncbi:PTS system mannose/fructose/sorbose family transporter subunit IID [Fusobacterium sp.]|uniref:PTS system mannose/fructose/sorbose family transporter subunit IID n=1 Tax=Fusobacterium sp. TaxID=68766 RepID=UPI0025C5548C|nr:PTS system mannose/fructose/sorbose family transporter subunit IID [Fusobacterium sp.]
MTEKKLSKKALVKSWKTWMMHNLSSMSFERLESFGFCYSMVPIIEELYKDSKKEKIAALKRHSVFYNTEPQLGAIINGIACGLEEKRANGQKIEDELINGLKVGMMGPVAGIGDSMIPGMLVPILLSIGMGLSANGSIMGPIFYILLYLGIVIPGSYFLFMKGYTLGTDAVKFLVDERAERLKESFSILGVFITGGIAANYVKATTKLSYMDGSVNINIQNILDGIFPNLIPLVIVGLVYYLMTKKKFSSLKVMLALLVLVSIGVVIGVF